MTTIEYDVTAWIEKRVIHGAPALFVAQTDEGHKRPFVFVIHGLSSRKERHLDFCVTLSEAGYRACAVDAAFHGDRRDRDKLASMEDYNDPRFAPTFAETVQITIADVISIADELKLERYGIVGHSMGGYIATLVAAQDKRAHAIVNIAGSLPPLPDAAPFFNLQSGDAARTIAPRPTLLLHGEQDTVVPLSGATDFLTVLRETYGDKAALAALKTYPTVGHELAPEMIAETIGWMEKYMVWGVPTLDAQEYRNNRVEQTVDWHRPSLSSKITLAESRRKFIYNRVKAKLGQGIGTSYNHLPTDTIIEETRAFPGYTRETVTFTTRPGLRAFGYFLLPDGLTTPAPAVLCVPGHGRGVDSLVGIAADGSQRALGEPDEYQQDFALEAVRQGYAVFALEPISFGHRRDAQARAAGQEASSCTRDSMAALMLGDSMAGWRVQDAMATLGYLQTRVEVDGERLGMLGISGGGMVTLFTAAMDVRVKVTGISGYFNTFADSILAMDHCVDNFVPGLLTIAEMPDIAGLIAPRALIVESGSTDPIFPRAAFDAACTRTSDIFDAFGAPDRFAASRFEGGHIWHGAEIWPFLREHL